MSDTKTGEIIPPIHDMLENVVGEHHARPTRRKIGIASIDSKSERQTQMTPRKMDKQGY